MSTSPSSSDRVAPSPLEAGPLGRLYRPPFVGIFAFFIVLGIVPLMHSMLTLILDNFEQQHQTGISIALGAIAVGMVVYGTLRNTETLGTWMGFIAAHIIWSSWIELAFRFNPDYMNMGPLVVDGERILTASLLFVQATVGLLMATLPFFVFNRDTRCNAFLWIQRAVRFDAGKPLPASERNFARITFLEVLYVIWFCYAVSLFLVDKRFLGPHHTVTYVVSFGLMLWTFYLLLRLVRFTRIMAGIRYSIPTAGLFWTTVEIAHEWGLYDEFWSKPAEYAMEMGIVLAAFLLAVFLAVIMPRRRTTHAAPAQPANQ